MELLKQKFYIKKGDIVIKKESDGSVTLHNRRDSYGLVVIPKLIFNKKREQAKVTFEGSIVSGKGADITLLDRRRNNTGKIGLNSVGYFDNPPRVALPIIGLPGNSKVTIKKLTIDLDFSFFDELEENFSGNILLLTPGYASLTNKYAYGFIHTRVKAYQELNWNVDVAVVHEEPYTEIYTFDGVKICQTSYFNVRKVLQDKKYDKIFVHFFSDRFAQILDGSDMSETKIYLYSHGADSIYRDSNIMTAHYFKKPKRYELWQQIIFEKHDELLRRYNEKKNVKWIFVTPWALKRSEETNNIKYKNSTTIPCLINEKRFVFEKKDPELRKKIFILRKFDNISTYSIDIDVRVILELSNRPFFNDLEFNIYGEGSDHKKLLEPIRKFDNVHIYDYFLTHEEMAAVHKENGIALFATRYDTQGVSACEAAMSGLVVISSQIPGVKQVIDPSLGTLCDTENYVEYADKIEELYYNSDKFLEISAKMHDFVLEQCGYKSTIQKELDMFAQEETLPVTILPKFKEPVDIPVLTIAVPAYNVEKFLRNSIYSLIRHELAHKLEILIINDGSKDKTAEIGRELQELTTVNGKSIVKLIDKENGGHGSAINKGIELATGRYFKLMDGDDYFDTESLVKLINYLENETSDMVLNNYVEDWTVTCEMRAVHHYEFMNVGMPYSVQQLCYKHYGFSKWGPLLSTSTFRTQMLKDADFKISEKCFYVDMELNFFAFLATESIAYYPLDIYIYQLGNPNQSVSAESFKRNYKNHEKVTMRLIKEYSEREESLSYEKRKYLKEHIILPLIEGQHYITTEHFKNRQPFIDFDKQLKNYPAIYNDKKVATKKIKMLRKTNGHFFRMICAMAKFKNKISKKKK